jgi:two-component system invasion response regulator UvrY
MKSSCTVLICDDHSEFRDLVKHTLKRTPHIQVIGEAGNGKEAVEKALRLRPHVVLMDLSMPELGGLEATRRIRKASRRIRVLVVSGFPGEDLGPSCLDAGASGYFCKYTPLSQLSQAIETVRKGHRYVSPDMCERVSRAY